MKKLFGILLIGLLVYSHLLSQESRQILSMDFNWKFHLGDMEQGSSSSLDDSEWRVINLPHDLGVEGSFDRDAPAGGRG